jgi:uncharacterized repeat protein (TIGR01451 family)
MNTSIEHPEPNGIVQPSRFSSQSETALSALRSSSAPFVWVTLLAGLLFLLFSAPAARADRTPAGCTGSGLGISLFTSIPDVHIGDTLFYSVLVFNTPFPACNASEIQAWVVTPDGVTNTVTLLRTTLEPGQSDLYNNVVSYVVRAQDILPDGTLRATANDTGVIHQNDTNSRGGGFQGVNTEVNLPCIALTAQCVGSVGENGAITFTGTVTNCGNNILVGVTVTNFNDNGSFTVLFPTNLAIGQIATFSGSWVPLNPCGPNTATLTTRATDEFTATPKAVTSFTTVTCQNTLNPGIKVTKACPAGQIIPGQMLTFSGSVSNTGNVTLTNIVVVNSQPAANTTVFTRPTLAPGEVVTFNGSYTAPTNCSVADTLTATATSRCGVGVSSVASATCPILTTPQISVTAACPTTPVTPGSTVTYSGTVRNTGNITLKNVAVVSDRPAANTTVFTAPTLAPGASAAFTGSYTVPANACSVTANLNATGQDQCTSLAVTSPFTSTCPVTTAPAIAVTLACPATPPASGGSVAYTGTVRNTGNVTLNNVTVINNQAVPSMVLTVPSLAPGVSANFTANVTAPVDDCSVSSTVTVTGSDACTSALVSNSTSATCPLTAAPSVAITQVCPESPAVPGSTLTYSSTVRNTGNTTLTNVVVLNNLSGATPVFTSASLAPNATASFTGSYVAPTNCSSTSTSTVTARSVCGVPVSNSSTVTCPILTAPQISVTAVCPTAPVTPGSTVTYSGTVRNTGNSTLTSVVVVSDRPAANTTVFTAPSLAPGASAAFTGSYTVPANACSVTANLKATGTEPCASAAISNTTQITCPVTTAPAIAVTLACPATPAASDGSITYSGTVRNSGNVTLNNVTVVNSQAVPNTNSGPFSFGTINSVSTAVVDRFVIGSGFNGLTYAGEDHGYGATEFYSMRKAGTGTSYFDTIIAGTANIADRFDASSRNFDAVAYAAPDVGYGPVIFYYLSHDNAGVSTFGSITPGGVVGVTTDHFVVGNNFDALTFAATDVGYGANLFYYVRHDATGLSTFGTINPALPGTITDRFTIGFNVDALVFTDLSVPGYGANNFYYLRHDASGASTFGTILVTGLNTATVTDRLPVGMNATELTFTATDVGFGPNLFYFLRGGGNATGTNTQTVFTVPSLAPGASANFTTTLSAPVDACSISSTVTATGSDACTSALVSNSASATCPLTASPSIAVTQVCPESPAVPGGTLTYSGTVRNTGNTTLTNVVVLNNLSGATPVFTSATLAPGATANFTGSYVAPTNCSSTSTSTATARSVCGVAVSNSSTVTCTIQTAPQISVTAVCPTAPVAPGGTLTYSGTVRNTGNITLKNVAVVSDRPAANTTVFTVATLAPGVSAAFTGSYTVAADACALTANLKATGQDQCTDAAVTSTFASTCNSTTTPAIAVTLACPATPAAGGGLITYTGTVRNSGNVTLNNVTVVSSQAVPSTVLTVPSLAPGVSANFTANVAAPADTCSVSSAVTASGTDNCAGTVVNNSASATCTLVTAPRIAVTQTCPANPAGPGELVTYGGSVSNAGNITLTNVVVTQGTQVPSETIWVDDALPASAVEGFDKNNGDSFKWVGSNPTPFSGSLAHQSTISAGEHQHYFISANPAFAINTGDILVAYVYLDPANVPSEVMLQWNDGSWAHRAYWGANLVNDGFGTNGTVSRQFMGGLPAVGQWVRLEVPASVVGLEGHSINGIAFTLYDGRATWDAAGKVSASGTSSVTPVFTAATLAPGTVADFSFSQTVPANSGCSITSTLTGKGNDKCTGNQVTASVSSTCPLLTAPLITVTQTCPVNLVSAGGILTYSGTVRNAGNITLTNVVVLNNRPADNTVVFTAASLAPGASANFTGSYEVPLNCCVVWSTATASGKDTCTGNTVTDTDTTTCTVLTAPKIVVTKVCPAKAVEPGQTLQYSGTVSNAGNITLADVTIVNNQPSDSSPVFGPITLAPGESVNYNASYLVPPDFCGMDTVTARGFDACTFAPVVNSVTTTCPILTTPSIAVTKNCPSQTTPRGGLFTFTGTVSNPGNVTLINVMVANNYLVDCYSRTNGPVIGPITLAPKASVNFSGSYTAPMSCCEVVDTLTASGQDRCAGTRVTATATAICPLLSTPRITVTRVCPASPVPVGNVFAYSGSVSNAGDVVLTNVYVLSSKPNANTSVLGPMTLAPGETEVFSGSYTVTADSNPSTDTVTASGTDICQGRTVIAMADCSGAVIPLTITSVTLTNGLAKVTWAATLGTTYRLQSATNFGKAASWNSVPGDVTATGNTASKTDTTGIAGQRFYRVIQP